MFMHKVIAFAPYNGTYEALKNNSLENALKEANAASAFKPINSGILSIM